jgi:hypothetical protein
VTILFSKIKALLNENLVKNGQFASSQPHSKGEGFLSSVYLKSSPLERI